MRLRQRRRLLTLLFSSLIIFSLLAGRLAYLQLARGGSLAREAVRQRAQTITLDYNRGDILDRNGLSLLGGEREKVLAFFPGLLSKDDPLARETILSLIPASAPTDQPSIALRRLSDQEEAHYAALQSGGLVVTEAQKRYGPGALATHVVGHVGPEDGKGKVGLELVFDETLGGGRPHVLAAVVDGRKDLIGGIGFRLWGESVPFRPYNLVLTIDRAVQQKVEEIMDERVERGAVVIMDPRSGDILAMASRPNYYQARLAEYLQDTDGPAGFSETRPLINRSILAYPPGSVFKIVVAAAALEAGNYSLGSPFYCPGFVQIGNQHFHCSQKTAHGHLTLAQAFAQSCNTVFIGLAMELGRETICDYAARLGLGQVCGLPLGNTFMGGEATGHIPTPQEIPYLGDLALTAIGQGSVEATPLQIARLTAVITNGGYLVEPRLARAIQTPQGIVVKSFPEGKKARVIDPLTAAKIRLMMQGVVEYGTGRAAQGSGFSMGGKSGTAETGRLLDGAEQHYSWFSGFLSKGENKTVVTVFIEKPLQGSAAGLFGALAGAIEEIWPELESNNGQGK